MSIETVVRFCVRFVAAFVLAAHWTYRAGVATGRFVHWLNDWLTAASKEPLATATRLAEAALTWAEAEMAEPQPKAEPSLAEAEPAPAKPKRVARRKPATTGGTTPAKPKRVSRRKPAEAPKAETEA